MKVWLANGDMVESCGFAMGLVLCGKWHAYVHLMVVDLAFDSVLGLPMSVCVLIRLSIHLKWKWLADMCACQLWLIQSHLFPCFNHASILRVAMLYCKLTTLKS